MAIASSIAVKALSRVFRESEVLLEEREVKATVAVARATVEVMAVVAAANPPSQAPLIIAAVLQAPHGLPTPMAPSSLMA
jgi:hypothetical protein